MVPTAKDLLPGDDPLAKFRGVFLRAGRGAAALAVELRQQSKRKMPSVFARNTKKKEAPEEDDVDADVLPTPSLVEERERAALRESLAAITAITGPAAAASLAKIKQQEQQADAPAPPAARGDIPVQLSVDNCNAKEQPEAGPQEFDVTKIMRRPARAGRPRAPLGPFTIVLFGNKDVGKTTLMRRYVEGTCETRRPTVVADIFSKTAVLENGDAVKLTLWDTAGAEEYRAFLPLYMRRLDAAVLVYAVDDRKSALALQAWHEFVANEAPHCAVWFVVANKIDWANHTTLSAECRENLGCGMQIASACGVSSFRTTSALCGLGVETLFTDIATCLRDNQVRVASGPPAVLRCTVTATEVRIGAAAAAADKRKDVIVLCQEDYDEGDMRREVERILERAWVREERGVFSFCHIL